MKFTMQSSVSVGANATNDSVLSAQRYVKPPFNALGTLFCTGSALGLTAELNVGGRSVTTPCAVNAQNRLPVVPDDVLVDGFEAVQEQLIQLTVVNTTGGALTFFWRIDLEVVDVQ